MERRRQQYDKRSCAKTSCYALRPVCQSVARAAHTKPLGDAERAVSNVTSTTHMREVCQHAPWPHNHSMHHSGDVKFAFTAALRKRRAQPMFQPVYEAKPGPGRQCHQSATTMKPAIVAQRARQGRGDPRRRRGRRLERGKKITSVRYHKDGVHLKQVATGSQDSPPGPPL